MKIILTSNYHVNNCKKLAGLYENMENKKGKKIDRKNRSIYIMSIKNI